MRKISASDLARNTSAALNQVASERVTLTIERNHRVIAQLIPAQAQQTAAEALTGLFGVLSDAAAKGWLTDSRLELDQDVHDPWE